MINLQQNYLKFTKKSHNVEKCTIKQNYSIYTCHTWPVGLCLDSTIDNVTESLLNSVGNSWEKKWL